MGLLCAMGSSPNTIKKNLIEKQLNLTQTDDFSLDTVWPLGLYQGELPAIPLSEKKWKSRNNQFALAALKQIEPEITAAIEQFGAHRVGVIIGTSTSGISDSEPAISEWLVTGEVPKRYDYGLQEMGATANFVAKVLGLHGPAYGISTACSSGAKALAAAKRQIDLGVCDAVIAGGVDTICQLTVQGFASLQALSDKSCNPFSVNRKGINIGEGAALFLVTGQTKGVELVGYGESSDAYHISAPDPMGNGAIKCMTAALDDAGIEAKEVGYVNLHGTATALNDQMEALAMNKVFGAHTLCSSTKPFTGHTLGAAGAVEAGICWLMLSSVGGEKFLPFHIWDGVKDPDLPEINLVTTDVTLDGPIRYVLSNSFAFGGNNVSLLLGRV